MHSNFARSLEPTTEQLDEQERIGAPNVVERGVVGWHDVGLRHADDGLAIADGDRPADLVAGLLCFVRPG